MNVHVLLQQLGFGGYEAKAYIGLLGCGQCNGYEIAKAAGMPRANVYAVLERLVERGAAQRVQTPQGLRYVATAPQQLLAQIDQTQQRALKDARKALTAIDQPNTSAPAFNLRSQNEVLDRAHADIDTAHKTLLVAIQPSEAARLTEPLERARKRGVAITTLCLGACEGDCGGCQGHIHHLSLAPQGEARWLLLVVDQRSALLGQFGATSADGLVTTQPLVIELASTYVRQSLALALLGSELGGQFDGLVSQDMQQTLNHLYPGGDFLAHIQSLGQRASS